MKKLKPVDIEKLDKEFDGSIETSPRVKENKPRIYPMLDVFQKDVQLFEWHLGKEIRIIMVGTVLDQNNNSIGKYKSTKYSVSYGTDFDMMKECIVPIGCVTYHEAVTRVYGLKKEYTVTR